jgi:molybdopterin synthase sulfur carrier subunit
MLKIRFFASLSEQLGTRSESLELDIGISTVRHLVDTFVTRGEPWSTAFLEEDKVLVALNQEISDLDSQIADGDEVAFFPPVTGG